MNPTAQFPLDFNDRPSDTLNAFLDSRLSKFPILAEEILHKPTYGPILTDALKDHLIDRIPIVPAHSLGLFDQETVLLPDPYLPNVFPDLLDSYFVPQNQSSTLIHAAQGVSQLGRSFFAFQVEVTTETKQQFHMVEVMFQKAVDNSHQFVGVPNNTTNCYEGAISSVYDGSVIESSCASLLSDLLKGKTIKSPTAEHYGLSWMVRAI